MCPRRYPEDAAQRDLGQQRSMGSCQESIGGEGKGLEQAGAPSETRAHSRLQGSIGESVTSPCIPCQRAHICKRGGAQTATLQALLLSRGRALSHRDAPNTFAVRVPHKKQNPKPNQKDLQATCNESLPSTTSQLLLNSVLPRSLPDASTQSTLPHQQESRKGCKLPGESLSALRAPRCQGYGTNGAETRACQPGTSQLRSRRQGT